MKIRCLLVDDEIPALDELAYILAGIRDIEVTGTATNASKAVDAIRSDKPDVVFLDIQMPGGDGFSVIDAVGSDYGPPFFIFSTAYDRHALKAFDARAIDYILKPFQPERVRESVDRARQMLQSLRRGNMYEKMERFVERLDRPSNETIMISVEHRGRILLLDARDIVCFKADNKQILACAEARCHPLHGHRSLDELETNLGHHAFFRAHRGYLVNLRCIREVAPWFNGRYILIAADKDNTEIPVSRNRVKALKIRLGLT